MRLTLRTLLAYIDNVLSPANHDELHRRIQQNEGIGRLLKRIQYVTSQPDMLSPRLKSAGLAGDPNAIAEYLDDALSSANVPELERLCLESDEQLAELAHCHRLLATAMHTPVAVSDSLRSLALDLIDPARRAEIESQLLTRKRKRERATVQVVATLASAQNEELTLGSNAVESSSMADTISQVPAPMVASGGGSIRPEGLDLEDVKLTRDVPEYLVGMNRGMWRAPVAIFAVAALLAIMIWQSLGPWDQVRRLLVSNTKQTGPDDPPLRVREQATPDDSKFDELIVSAEPPPIPAGNKSEIDVGAAAGPESTSEGSASDASAGEASNDPAIESDDASPPIPGSTLPASEGSDTPIDIDASDSAPPMANSAAGAPRADTAGPDALPPVASPSVKPPVITETTDQALDFAVWAPQDESQQTVIFGAAGDGWQRMQAGQSLEGFKLVVPPYSRTLFTLPTGVQWTACGPSKLQFGKVTEEPQVEVGLCKAFVSSPAMQPLRIATSVGLFRVLPASAETIVAVEFGYRATAAGSLLDADLFRPVLVLTVVEGSAKIESLGQLPDSAGPDNSATKNEKAEYSLELGEAVGVVGGGRLARFKIQTIPDWFRSSTTRTSDTLALKDMVATLQGTGPEPATVEAALYTLAGSRRAETAALAVQASALCGRWQPFVGSFLDDARNRSYWNAAIDLSRQIAASDPGLSQGVQTAFVAKHGEQLGDEAYRLLMGVPAEVLATSSVSPLIAQLESPSLTMRVLAAYHLEKLTGMLQAYQPHAPNKSSVQQWRRDLATKRIAILPIADVFYERAGP